jgi:hypothetical protein
MHGNDSHNYTKTLASNLMGLRFRSEACQSMPKSAPASTKTSFLRLEFEEDGTVRWEFDRHFTLLA